MRALIVTTVAVAVAAAPFFGLQRAPSSAEPAGADRGEFQIHANGRPIGVEKFSILPSPEGLRATADLQITVDGAARLSETATLVLRRGVEPATYDRVQKSPKRGSAHLVFGPQKTIAQYKTADAGTQDMEFFVPKNVVVLDTNFFHHYTFLIRQYDFLKAGSQHIDVIVPQEASPGIVRLEFVGADQGLRKLVARTEELEIHIWADDAGRVMKLAVPSAKVEVFREK